MGNIVAGRDDPSVRFDHIESVSRYDVVEFFLHERERLIVAHAEQRTVITGIQFGNFQSLVFPDRIRRIIIMLRRRPYGGFHTGSVQIIGDRPDVERIVPIHFFVVPAHAAQIVVDMHHIEAEISRLLRQRDDLIKGNFGKRRPRIRRTKRKNLSRFIPIVLVLIIQKVIGGVVEVIGKRSPKSFRRKEGLALFQGLRIESKPGF